jgi:hypothetical protein
MTALECPSCHSKLKAPEKLAGQTAPCPRCRAEVVVPFVKRVGLVLSDTKTHRPVLPAASAETVEMAAMEATARHAPLKEQRADEEPEPVRRTRRGVLLGALATMALASAAAFALWMAMDAAR